VRYQDLAASLKKNGPAPVYAITGEDDYLRDQALVQIKAAVLGEHGIAGFNYDLFYGGEAPATAVLTCAMEVPAFASRRLVVYKAADKISARDADVLLPYLEAPCESTTLVFVAPKLDGRLKLTQALQRRAVTIDCSALRDAQLTAWIREEARCLGLQLQEDAVALLKDAAGESLYAVRRELEKLAAYMPSGALAGPREVEMLRGTEPGASVFDLTTAIGAQDRGRALTILARNLEAGEAPLRILGALIWQYRRLWRVKETLRQNGKEFEAARALRMEPHRVRPFLAQFSDAHLRTAFQLFLEADSRLKGGSTGSGRRVLEALLLQLCERVGASPLAGSPPDCGTFPRQASGGKAVQPAETVTKTEKP
jgi:DNA polymerase-3 subunit delta